MCQETKGTKVKRNRSFLHHTIRTIAIIVKHKTSAATRIQVKINMRNALRKIGHMEDDYNAVIDKLIIEHNRSSLVEHGK
jgi:hypothetical protein